MVIDVLAEMDEEKGRSAEAGAKFTFLFLTMKVGPKKNGQPATVGQKVSFRPLYALDQSLLMLNHSIYNLTTDTYTSAICAKEVGKECFFCAAAAAETDKKQKHKLEAKKSLMLPTWLHGIREQFELKGPDGKPGPWFALKVKSEEGEEKPITGMRVLELTNFGAIEPVFSAIRRIHSGDSDENIAPRDIRTLDLIMECHGIKKDKRMTLDKKDPSPMSAEAKAAIPTREAVRALILENRPPRIVGAVSQAKPEEVVLNSKEDFLREIAKLKHIELNVDASGQVAGGSLVGASDDLEF